MDRWCFVHAADLHLDTPFEGVGAVDGAVATRLRDASLAAFDSLVELTIAREARFLVLAGDIYDGPERGVRAQLRFEAGLRLLAEHGIATFVVHGNHDPVATGWQLVTDWPDGVHVFGPDEVGEREVRDDEGRLVAIVQGVSYAERAETRNLARRFRRGPHDVLHVGVLHANVGGNGEHAPYAPCTVDDLRRAGIDYWALGHIHCRTVVLDGTGGDPWAIYPGNLSGRSVRPTEQGPKGATVVEVVDGAVAGAQHVPLDHARFASVAVRIDGVETLGELHRLLGAALDEEVAAAGGRVLVVRAELGGVGPVAVELARPGARDALVDALRDHVTGSGQVVVTGLRDRARPTTTLDPVLVDVLDDLPAIDAAEASTAAARGQRWSEALPDPPDVAAAARATVEALLAVDDR